VIPRNFFTKLKRRNGLSRQRFHRLIEIPASVSYGNLRLVRADILCAAIRRFDKIVAVAKAASI
jgi:hypothetical protein